MLIVISRVNTKTACGENTNNKMSGNNIYCFETDDSDDKTLENVQPKTLPTMMKTKMQQNNKINKVKKF